jgi:uncharacterized RDD family membrane protein YckC
MKFHCPNCRQKIDAPVEYAGATINCPSCQGQIQVPAPAPTSPALSINRPAAAPVAAPPIPAAAAGTPQDFPDAAPLGTRIVAKALDYIFQIALMAGISFGWFYEKKALAHNGTGLETIALIGVTVMVVVAVLPFFYNYLPLASSGATPGKKLFGLRVVRLNRQPLGYAWAVLRVLAEYVSVGACYGLALMIFIGAVRTQMHHGPGEVYTPPPPVYQPGTRYTPPEPPGHPSNNPALKLMVTMPIFLLVCLPYVPAFFTKGRRATHDLIVRTLVVS